jgi:hypothetical protein
MLPATYDNPLGVVKLGVYFEAVDVLGLNGDRVPPFCENESDAQPLIWREALACAGTKPGHTTTCVLYRESPPCPFNYGQEISRGRYRGSPMASRGKFACAMPTNYALADSLRGRKFKLDESHQDNH